MRISSFVLGLAVSTALSTAVPTALAAPRPEGVLPAGADGAPLNLDFETGTLKDWAATGDAFDKQPIEGDVVVKRRADNKSQHQGKFWIGGFERAGDKPTGTLTSVPFKVTHPYASFLLGGAPNRETRVEIVRNEDQKIIFTAVGVAEAENLLPVGLDLKKEMGKEIFIRLVDEHTGHWGHLNFDDFRFHTAALDLPPRAAAKPPPPPADVVKNAGLKPEDAVKAITPAKGFSVSLFAAEPDIVQPIAFCMDDRGRLWIAEGNTYPKRAPEGQGKDNIIILEDTDGDGKFDKRTVFITGLNLVSGIEVGHGGLWVGAAPYFMFIPDKNGDDKPDGEPQILLDGFDAVRDTHETLNAFNWGPDGWLYGCHGVFTDSRVGKPGTPDADRIKLNCGIWRYHPTKNVFEVFAHGTSNPWGVDFNDYGQCFETACVVPHLFHMIQGGRYDRQGGKHFNPYTYSDIKTIADHRHWNQTAEHQWAANNRSDAMGGGHAHAGAMIYLGDSFPQQYRNSIFMGNIHGNRFNNDILVPSGSGYIGKHGPDFLLMNDKWSRLINLKYGPDGGVYFIDWYDKQACHVGGDIKAWDRGNGRVYKVSYDGTKGATGVNLAALSDSELVKLQTHNNDWYVRHARRILAERKSGGVELLALLKQQTEPAKHLRALWALHGVGGVTEEIALGELKNSSDYVRAWAIQLLCEGGAAVSEPVLKEFARLAADDPSPVVRLYLASAMQRVPLEQRWEILGALAKHAEDAADQNIPLMIWYALEPLAAADGPRALKLVAATQLPNLRTYVVQRGLVKAK